VPEDVNACDVDVGVYGVVTVLHPRGKEVRVILWDSFFGMKNAEAVAYMRKTAQTQLETLRGMRFTHRAVFSDAWRKRQGEIERLLKALGEPAKESAEAANLHNRIAARAKRLRDAPDKAKPDDEVRLVEELKKQEKLLWHLRWKDLFKE